MTTRQAVPDRAVLLSYNEVWSSEQRSARGVKRKRRVQRAFATVSLLLLLAMCGAAAPGAGAGQESVDVPMSWMRNAGAAAAFLLVLCAALWYVSIRWAINRETAPLRRELAQRARSEDSLMDQYSVLTKSSIERLAEPILTAKSAEAEDERTRALERLQKLNKLKEVLLVSGGLEDKLKTITDSLSRLFDVDFCRIWLTRPGDLCNGGCIHSTFEGGPHACHRHESCLHLMASSGKHARADSKMHHRVPFGCYKIGRVGAGQEKRFLTNDIANDRRVPNPKWAAELGFVSFAGYKLESATGDPIGVLAFFSRHPISSEEDAMLESMANSIAQAIHAANAEEALRENEKKFRTLYEASSDAVMLFDESGLFDCNESALDIFGCKVRADFLGKHLHELSPPTQEAVRTASGSVESGVLAEEEFDRAIAEGSSRFEWMHLRADGTEFPADVLLTAMELEGKTVLQAVVRNITERKQAEGEREKLIAELRGALAEIKTLSGLLPICASCKKIRDDSGYWNQIELYVGDRSDAQFSHSICPDCKEKLYPELYGKKRAET